MGNPAFVSTCTWRPASQPPAGNGKYVVEVQTGGNLRYIATRSYTAAASTWTGMLAQERVLWWLDGLRSVAECEAAARG